MKPIDKPLYKCPKCKTNMLIHFNLFVVGPSGIESNVTKKVIYDKRVYFEGAGWDLAYHHCPKCGHCTERFSGAYRKLQRENKSLKARVSELEKENKEMMETNAKLYLDCEACKDKERDQLRSRVAELEKSR